MKTLPGVINVVLMVTFIVIWMPFGPISSRASAAAAPRWTINDVASMTGLLREAACYCVRPRAIA
jgi:hypothetical protein